MTERKFFRTLAAICVSAILAATPASAKETWDHVANIKESAARLAVLHKQQGSQGVLKFLDACYKTHLLASDFTQGLESCLAQDYMHTQVLAMVYARIPASERIRLGTPSPEGIADAMKERFASAYAQYKMSDQEQDDFKKLVNKVGMPIFVKGIFPAEMKTPPPAKPGNR